MRREQKLNPTLKINNAVHLQFIAGEPIYSYVGPLTVCSHTDRFGN